MGSGTKRLVMVATTAALLLYVTLAGDSGTDICNMTESDLRECKPAVTAPDPQPPSPACCSGLAKADLPCLCSYRDSLLLPALGIDPDLAVQLPSKCGLTPPSEC